MPPLLTFDPPTEPSYRSARNVQNRTDPIQLHNGITQVRSITQRPLRVHSLSWNDADQATADYIESFVDGLEGGLGPFLWQSYDPHPSPTGVKPTLESVAGGALGARTYYVAFTYLDNVGSLETQVGGEASIALSASTFLKVTVPPRANGATHVGIYIGTTSGDLKRETIITGRTWTQSVALAGSLDEPASNNFKPTLRYLMGQRGVNVVPTAFGNYNITCEFLESFV